jgi:hypothetical protein
MLILGAVTSNAWADNLPEPTPAALQEATKLYLDLHGDEMHVIYEKEIIKSLIATIAQSSGQPAEKVAPAVYKYIVPDLLASLKPRRDEFIKVLARHLSVEDMLQLEAFEHSPLGLRLNAARTAMVQEMYGVQETWIRTGWVPIYGRHREELKQAGIVWKGSAQ